MMRKNRWFAGLILAAVVAGSGSVSHAAGPGYWNSGKTFSVEPKMNFIPNTDVYYQRRAPGYDFYRYANRWYLVQEGNWYEAGTWRGPFAVIDVAAVPEELTGIPMTYRKHWGGEPQESWASERTFTKKPKMTAIDATRVSYGRQFTDFDLYRYRSAWYLVENGIWFRSDSWKGPFMSTPPDSVPSTVRSVPSRYRRHWEAPSGT